MEINNLKGKTTILGVGAELRHDDYCGMELAKRLQDKVDKTMVQILLGSSAPENFTGEIINFKPDTLIIIDAADINKQPGEYELLDYRIVEGVSFSTHMLPLKIVLDYLKLFVKDLEIHIIGIKPKTVEFGIGLSREVIEGIEKLEQEMIKILK